MPAVSAVVPLVACVLMPGAISLSGSKILANELSARGFPGVNTIISLGGAIVTLLGDIVLIARYGIAGASVASTGGYSASFAMTWIAFHRRSEAPLLIVGGT